MVLDDQRSTERKPTLWSASRVDHHCLVMEWTLALFRQIVLSMGSKHDRVRREVGGGGGEIGTGAESRAESRSSWRMSLRCIEEVDRGRESRAGLRAA